MKKIFALSFFISLPTFAAAYGTYTVPVPPQLAPYATFVMNDSQITRDNTGVVMTYDLPVELVGPNHPTIVLGGKHREGGIMLLEGEFGEASCFTRAEKVECIVQYEDLEIDIAGVERILAARNISPHERELRLQVAKIFGGEPVGIVEISK